VNATNVLLSDVEIGWLGGGARDPILPGVQRLQSFGAVGACARRDAGGVLALDFPLQTIYRLMRLAYELLADHTARCNGIACLL
jgi:hypothetical protein